MDTYFDARQLSHAPVRELHNGEWTAYNEVPGRARIITRHFPNLIEPADFGMAPLLRVHDPDYLDFLATANAQWLANGRSGDAIGYTFPIVRRRPCTLDRIDAKVGYYSFDAATPITPDTWTSAYWSAQTALAAAEPVIAGHRRNSFALCRPPGHHAGRDYMGGYCYLNNAAIAARHAQAKGCGPVALLDIDYHHGNGTQDIFYEDPDILVASVHADPRTDYPFFWGHSDEHGTGAGTGANFNFPLPHGTTVNTYRATLEKALRAITDWGAKFLILSFGADTFSEDPISNFSIAQADFPVIGADIAALSLPTVIVMEGGYNVEALGENVAAFVSAFD